MMEPIKSHDFIQFIVYRMFKSSSMGAQLSRLFSRISNPTLRYGLMWGIPLAILQAALIILPGFWPGLENLLFSNSLISIPLLFFVLFAFFAGLRTGQATNKISSGILAGLLAAVIGFLFAGLTLLIQTAILVQYYVNSYKTHPAKGVSPSTYTASYVLIATAVDLVPGLLFYALFAIIAGAIGGFLGKRRGTVLAANQNTQQDTQEVAYEQTPLVQMPEPRTEQPLNRNTRTIHRPANPQQNRPTRPTEETIQE